MTSRADNRNGDPNDDALDAMLETIARPDAPATLTARVSAALDARETSRFGYGLGFSVTAAAGIALLVGAIWIVTKHSSTPVAPAMTTRSTTTAGPAAPAARASTPTPVASVQDAGPAAMSLHAARVTQARASRQNDHDRALPALDVLPAVLPTDITPRSLETTSLEIDPMNAIAPLTVQGGRDTSGRGDF